MRPINVDNQCGCVIEPVQNKMGDIANFIRYCPLHEAAPEAARILKELSSKDTCPWCDRWRPNHDRDCRIGKLLKNITPAEPPPLNFLP